MNKHFKTLIPVAIVLIIMGYCNISISTIFAGKSAYFGLSNMVMPALAAASGIGSIMLMTLYVMLKFSSATFMITKGLPTLAALYSAQCTAPSWRSKALNIGIPAAATVAFIVHPVGNAAWVYSLFWIIPVVGELLRTLGVMSLFNRMLTATFVAHAIGSVMWLYLMPTTPATWIGLLTVVPAERLVFASGATLVAMTLGVMRDSVVNVRTAVMVKKQVAKP